jgi:hypothetical protein
MASMHEALEQAMGHHFEPGTVDRIHQEGMAIGNVDTMSQAIHDVYCGIEADHDGPNEKDRQQALAMIGALQKYAATRPPA